MKVAIVGSRGIGNIDISKYIPREATLIISGGAKGIDTLAEEYADKNSIKKLIIKPDYKRFRKAAPIIRNSEIIKNADLVIAIWDGVSRGTKSVIKECEEIGKKILVHRI